MPHDLMPHAFNSKRGYFASANHRSIASFYPIPSGFTFGGFGGRSRYSSGAHGSIGKRHT